MKRVSVVIPTFNRSQLVQQAIDSVLAQTHDDVEIIVVDDGSTDDTHKVLSKYENRIRYLYQENAGESVARQKGMELATGEYIAFLDSDDEWLPLKLEKQLSLLCSDPRIGLVFTLGWVIDELGQLRDTVLVGCAEKPDEMTLENMVLANKIVSGSTLLVRRECLAAVGPFDPAIRFGEDWDWNLRWVTHFPVGCIPEPLVKIRHHARGWLQAQRDIERMLADHMRILDKFFSLPGIAESVHWRELERLARAERYANAGFHSYAYGDTSNGKKTFDTAAELAPTRWRDPSWFLRYMANAATLLITRDDEEPGIAFMKTVASDPPDWIRGAAVSEPEMLAWLHIVLAHWHFRRGSFSQIWGNIFKALRRDPHWMQDADTISLMARSFLRLPKANGPDWIRASSSQTPWVVDLASKIRTVPSERHSGK